MHPKYPLAIRNLESKILKSIEKPSKLGEYDEKGDPYEHVHLVNNRMNYISIDDASK